MNIEWDFTAQSFLDQLPAQDQNRILHAVERLRGPWDRLDRLHMETLPNLPVQEGAHTYLLSAGNDLRVVLQRRENAIWIVDVFRQSQIESLRQLQRQG